MAKPEVHATEPMQADVTASTPAAGVQHAVWRAVLIALVSAKVALLAGSVVLYFGWGRAWHRRWGATDNEVATPLPGDDLVPNPRINVTHALTIDAPPSAVWPWLVQMGQGRGGFYSYTWIENLLKADIANSNRVLPEFQNLQVGDVVPLAAASKDLPGGISFPVALLEPQQLLVLHGDTRLGDGAGAPPVKPGTFVNTSWGFYLFPAEDGHRTRLVERWRVDYTPSDENKVVWSVGMEAGAFIMQRRMLLGVRERAEALAAEERKPV
ncbi:MAG: hypothetical protein ACRC1H_00185 [Caldilineaceae bacterium]